MLSPTIKYYAKKKNLITKNIHETYKNTNKMRKPVPTAKETTVLKDMRGI